MTNAMKSANLITTPEVDACERCKIAPAVKTWILLEFWGIYRYVLCKDCAILVPSYFRKGVRVFRP